MFLLNSRKKMKGVREVAYDEVEKAKKEKVAYATTSLKEAHEA